jgi:hypothetical protein
MAQSPDPEPRDPADDHGLAKASAVPVVVEALSSATSSTKWCFLSDPSSRPGALLDFSEAVGRDSADTRGAATFPQATPRSIDLRGAATFPPPQSPRVDTRGAASDAEYFQIARQRGWHEQISLTPPRTPSARRLPPRCIAGRHRRAAGRPPVRRSGSRRGTPTRAGPDSGDPEPVGACPRACWQKTSGGIVTGTEKLRLRLPVFPFESGQLVHADRAPLETPLHDPSPER